MPEQSSAADRVGPDRPGPPDKTWEDGSARRRRRPAVQRRTFRSEHGLSAPQWGIRDTHGTWHAYPDQLAALAAAFGEYAAA